MIENLFLGDTTYPHLPDVEQLQSRIAQLEADLAEARKDVERKTVALKKIAKWHDEFPPSCRFNEDGTQMSFGAAFGSNGQRDYMRGVAQLAIDAAIKEQGK